MLITPIETSKAYYVEFHKVLCRDHYYFYYILYVNGLPNASKFEAQLFADDTALFLSNDNSKTQNKNVNYELLNIEAWLNAIKLSLNNTKAKYLLIKPKTKTSQLCKLAVTIKGIELQKCQSA